MNNMTAVPETQILSLGQKEPLEKGMASPRVYWRVPTPVLLPGESHGQRSLVGYSQWGRRVRHNLTHGTGFTVNVRMMAFEF